MDQLGRQTHRSLHLFIASFLRIGMLSKRMPGTVGSIAATIIVLALPMSELLMIALAATTLIIGTLSCSAYLRQHGDDRDPAYIVIDEVCGIFLGSSIIYHFGLKSIVAIVCNFALFRLFDITKPPPIRNIEAALKNINKAAGFGIMLDDVLAACFASTTQILWSVLWER
ncbi:MAG: phosphatidylglycerophosphatase A [Holosporales bacterium]|jgi:phosphatidylglycerophosphatase A|nr:phosphatidylglycerophosphatase A [Holosporales bacterium]